MEGLSRYRIQRQIGQGGMGVVYLAHDDQLDRDVALKFCTAEDLAARKGLAQEARAASRLNHPNIAQIYDYGEDEQGRPFIVMELVEGGTLADRLTQGPLEVQEAARVGRAVAEALAEAHRAGIVHRDIKPGNVKITPRNEIKVLDFGLAHVEPPLAADSDSAPTLTVVGQIKGTPSYMSPEQAQGLPLDSRSDLFSLGTVLYECFTGRRPFGGRTAMEVVSQVISAAPPPPSTLNTALPPSLDGLVMRLLSKEPDDRPADASEVSGVLAGELSSQSLNTGTTVPAVSPPPARGPDTHRNVKRRAMRWLAVPMLALLIAAAIWLRPNAQLAPPARRWYAEGLIALQDGAWLKASNLLQKAATLDPGFPPVRARLAQAWLELDYPARAKDEMLRANQSPRWFARLPSTDAALVEAVQFAVLGEETESIAVFARRESSAPADERAQAALDHGRALERGEKWKDALDAYRRALTIDPQMAGGHVRLARLLAERLKQYPDAQKELDSAQDLYRTATNPEGLAEVEYTRALIDVARNQLPQAETRLRKVIQTAGETDNQQQHVKSSLLLVSVLLNRGDSEQALRIAGEAIETARASGLESLTTRSLIDAGRVLLSKGDLQPAERYLKQAIETAKRTSDRRSEARAGVNFASLLYTQGRYAEAVPVLESARQFYQQGSYPRQLLLTLILVGRVQLERSDYPASRSAFGRALQMAESGSDPVERGLSEEGLGSLERRRERYRDAYGHYERAEQAYAQAQNPASVAYIQSARADLLSRIGDFSAAAALLAAAEATATRQNDKGLQVTVALYRAESFARQTRWPDAATAAQRGLTLADPADRSSRTRLSIILALAQANLGLLPQALAACASTPGDQASYDEAQAGLTCARIFLLARQPDRAADSARRSAEHFAGHDHPESEWIAWAVAARANPADTALPARAGGQLNRLAALWSAADYQQYLRRPDVLRLRP